jgi:hypothetical protein
VGAGGPHGQPGASMGARCPGPQQSPSLAVAWPGGAAHRCRGSLGHSLAPAPMPRGRPAASAGPPGAGGTRKTRRDSPLTPPSARPPARGHEAVPSRQTATRRVDKEAEGFFETIPRHSSSLARVAALAEPLDMNPPGPGGCRHPVALGRDQANRLPFQLGRLGFAFLSQAWTPPAAILSLLSRCPF